MRESHALFKNEPKTMCNHHVYWIANGTKQTTWTVLHAWLSRFFGIMFWPCYLTNYDFVYVLPFSNCMTWYLLLYTISIVSSLSRPAKQKALLKDEVWWLKLLWKIRSIIYNAYTNPMVLLSVVFSLSKYIVNWCSLQQHTRLIMQLDILLN